MSRDFFIVSSIFPFQPVISMAKMVIFDQKMRVKMTEKEELTAMKKSRDILTLTIIIQFSGNRI